jgi:hypothetical protein
VLPAYQTLAWDGADEPVSCLVIEYHEGSELRARTWIRASDGLVLQQESLLNDEHLYLVRE